MWAHFLYSWLRAAHHIETPYFPLYVGGDFLADVGTASGRMAFYNNIMVFLRRWRPWFRWRAVWVDLKISRGAVPGSPPHTPPHTPTHPTGHLPHAINITSDRARKNRALKSEQVGRGPPKALKKESIRAPYLT